MKNLVNLKIDGKPFGNQFNKLSRPTQESVKRFKTTKYFLAESETFWIYKMDFRNLSCL